MTVKWDAQVREMLNNLFDMNPSSLIFIVAHQTALIRKDQIPFFLLEHSIKGLILLWDIF